MRNSKPTSKSTRSEPGSATTTSKRNYGKSNRKILVKMAASAAPSSTTKQPGAFPPRPSSRGSRYMHMHRPMDIQKALPPFLFSCFYFHICNKHTKAHSPLNCVLECPSSQGGPEAGRPGRAGAGARPGSWNKAGARPAAHLPHTRPGRGLGLERPGQAERERGPATWHFPGPVGYGRSAGLGNPPRQPHTRDTT